jgi:hypothetical protein
LDLAESAEFALLRSAAATLVLAAGVVHLAQIGPHSDEDPLFGLFFLVVGLTQLAGALYLLYPLGPDRLRVAVAWFGIIGSVAMVGIWAVSRTAGLPFGSEPDVPETIGLADAAADLFELITALLLVTWIDRRHLSERGMTGLAIAGASLALALAGLWLLTRQLRLFDPDPRLVAYGDLADLAAVGFLVLVAILFARILFVARAPEPASKMASLALLASLSLVALSLVAFTLPARGGQNPDCAYGPIREDSRLSHSTLPAPIHLAEGQVRSVVVLLLVACGPDPVAITSFDLIQPLGNAIGLDRITIDRSRGSRADRVRPGESSGPAAVGTLLDPSQGRYPVVVQVRGLQSGMQALSAFKIGWTVGAATGSIGLASFTSFCVADAPCPAPPSR